LSGNPVRRRKRSKNNIPIYRRIFSLDKRRPYRGSAQALAETLPQGVTLLVAPGHTDSDHAKTRTAEKTTKNRSRE
jgi:hypothetical protein